MEALKVRRLPVINKNKRMVGVRTRYLLLPSCLVPAHAFGSYFPQSGNEVGVRPSGPSRVDSRVELCGGLQILVAEELPKPEIKTYLNGKLVSDIVIDTSPLRTRIAV
jgi:hypothetical protein